MTNPYALPDYAYTGPCVGGPRDGAWHEADYPFVHLNYLRQSTIPSPDPRQAIPQLASSVAQFQYAWCRLPGRPDRAQGVWLPAELGPQSNKTLVAVAALIAGYRRPSQGDFSWPTEAAQGHCGLAGES